MKELIMQIIEHKYGAVRKKRSRIKIKDIEEAVIATYEYRSDYELASGFSLFQKAIKELLAAQYLTTLSKPKQYKTSSLDEVYWLYETASFVDVWNEASILRVLDAQPLKLNFYINHPAEQTAQVWEYIERIYNFLRNAGERELITREERSLELFDDEKFLARTEGKQLLKRLGITLDTLRAITVRELFESYRVPHRTVHTILISENHSFYDSAKRLMKSGQAVCGLQPDLLIYGEGWKIVSSLMFLEELAVNPLDTSIYYVGDMDKAGWDIYGNLKLSYPELKLNLALTIYEHMIHFAEQEYANSNEQNCPILHLEIVLQETAAVPKLKLTIETLLEDNKRIPQEVLNYEVMARLE